MEARRGEEKVRRFRIAVTKNCHYGLPLSIVKSPSRLNWLARNRKTARNLRYKKVERSELSASCPTRAHTNIAHGEGLFFYGVIAMPLHANRNEDANHRCAGMKVIVRIDSAWKRQVASRVCPFQESRGFGPRDSRRYNPESDGANEGH
jgi:hypothetical protein